MHHLIVGPHFLRLVAFADRRRVISFCKKGRPQRELRIEVIRRIGEDGLQPFNRSVRFPAAELEHRLVKFFL